MKRARRSLGRGSPPRRDKLRSLRSFSLGKNGPPCVAPAVAFETPPPTPRKQAGGTAVRPPVSPSEEKGGLPTPPLAGQTGRRAPGRPWEAAAEAALDLPQRPTAVYSRRRLSRARSMGYCLRDYRRAPTLSSWRARAGCQSGPPAAGPQVAGRRAVGGRAPAAGRMQQAGATHIARIRPF